MRFKTVRLTAISASGELLGDTLTAVFVRGERNIFSIYIILYNREADDDIY